LKKYYFLGLSALENSYPGIRVFLRLKVFSLGRLYYF